jgi:cell division protein FtsW
VLGLGAGFFVLKTPVSFFKKYSPLLFIVTLVLLILVFIPGITAGKINGAYRWIDVFGFFNFQPSEMMKLTMILFMAGFLIRQEKEVTSSLKGLGKTMFIVALSGTLTMFETDLGATIIITITALSMLFIAGTYIKELLITGGALFGAAGIFIWFNPNRSARLFDFWEIDLWSNHSDKVYQTKQALIGIARGDWTGTGLGAGIQKYTKLPESHTDMIFAIIGEELGIIGMLFVLFCFAYIIGKGFDIAKEALKHGRKYSSYVAFGICTWFSMQTGVNIAMNLGLIPIKGFTLPLISYGGSSMIFSMVALAFLLRIDMENRAGYTKKKNYV